MKNISFVSGTGILAISIYIFVAISAFFVAHVPFDSRLSFISSIFVIIFAIPSYLGLYYNVGLKMAFKTILFLTIFAVIFEYIAIKTGLPYGQFIYGDKIGFKMGGLVPWTVGFSWPPLVLGSYALAQHITKKPLKIIVLSASFLVLFDLVIDPGATALSFWIWDYPSGFYNVPWTNFMGWFISGLLGTAILQQTLPKKNQLSQSTNFIHFSTLLIILFWTIVDLGLQIYIPALLGLVLLLYIYQFNFNKRDKITKNVYQR